MAKKSIWDDQFTNQYELSKTLRFELKPIGNTQKMIDKNNVFLKDKLIKDKYVKTKPFFDRLHREFIEEALLNVSLSNLDNYKTCLDNWKKDKKNKEYENNLRTIEKQLREEVVELLNVKAKNWAEDKYKNCGLKNKNIEIFSEEAVFSILKARYDKEEESKTADEVIGKNVSIFDSWKGFTGYFTKFFETRKNFYKSNGTSTAITTRIINQNLKRFCDNLEIFECVKNKLDFSEVGREFSVDLKHIFSLRDISKIGVYLCY